MYEKPSQFLAFITLPRKTPLPLDRAQCSAAASWSTRRRYLGAKTQTAGPHARPSDSAGPGLGLKTGIFKTGLQMMLMGLIRGSQLWCQLEKQELLRNRKSAGVQTARTTGQLPMLLRTTAQEQGVRPKDIYLAADGVNFLRRLKDLFLKTRESALKVHLQQLQSSAAVAHLGANMEGDRQKEDNVLSLSRPPSRPCTASRKPSLRVTLPLAKRTDEIPPRGMLGPSLSHHIAYT